MTSVEEMASAVELWERMRNCDVTCEDVVACVSRVVTRGGSVPELMILWAIVRDINDEDK